MLVRFLLLFAIFAGSGNEERFYRLLRNDLGIGVFLTAIGFLLVSAGVLSSYKIKDENSEYVEIEDTPIQTVPYLLTLTYTYKHAIIVRRIQR